MRSDIDKADPFVVELGPRTGLFRFESWGEFLDLAERETTMPDTRRHSLDATSERDSFMGCRTFADAVKLARDGGWERGEKLAGEYSRAMFDAVSGTIERITYPYDVTGENLDVARFLEGEPECWTHPQVTLNEGYGRRIVKVVFNCTANGAVGAETMIAKGAAVAALVQLLEYAGHGVEVVLAFSNQEGTASLQTFTPIKAADQPVDLARLVFALAHPATLRRILFSVMEHLPADFRRALNVGDGYGRVASIPEREHGDVYIPGSSYGETQWQDPEKARTWVLDILEAQGVVLNRAAVTGA